MSGHTSRRPRRWAALVAATALTLSALAALTAPAHADGTVPSPDYYPSGPQTDVPEADVTGGGWTRCYLDTYSGDLESRLPEVLSACTGRYLMLAGRATGSDTLSLLAAAPRRDVLHDTGAADDGVTHAANGSEWYFNPHWSWGFAGAGEQVKKYQCDLNSGPLRLCWHTISGAGGFRVGDDMWLNDSDAYERVVYQSGEPGKEQSITFSTLAPESAYVTTTYDVAAVSDSGLPVTLSSDTPDVCSLADGTVTFRAAGTCTVRADQAGDETYDEAASATQTITIEKVPASVAVTTPTDTVSGQQVRFTATVTVPKDAPDSSPAGTVQFAVDGEPLGDPVPVHGDGSVLSPSTSSRAGQHDVTATYTPDDPATYDGAEGRGTLGVGPALTRTRLVVAPQRLTASVSVQAPGSAQPTGAVVFRVAGQEVGTAQLADGTAVLDHVVPAGRARTVSAQYVGDAEAAGSEDSLSRQDPSISARVTSSRPRSKAGWYSAPVRIDYTCAPRGAALSSGCPAPDRTARNGAQQSFTKTVSAVDGGLTTLTTTVDVDQVAPTVALRGVQAGRQYFAHGPNVACVGSDRLSGLASCVVTRTRGRGGAETVTATATDKAGNVARTSRSYRVVPQLITGATYADGTWTVRRGGSFSVLTQSASRPVYRIASATPARLGKASTRRTVRLGSDTWGYAPTWNMPRTRSGIWYVGVQDGRHLVALRVHMLG